MKKTLKISLLANFILFIILYLGIIHPAYSACSSSIDNATINEIYMGTGAADAAFIEVKLLDTSQSYAGWQLNICNEKQGDCIFIDVVNTITNDTYIVVEDADFVDYIDVGGGKKKRMEVSLIDSSGALVDYLSINNYTVSGDGACTFSYNTQHSGTNSKILNRLPDGTGDWAESNGGNSGTPTPGTSNEGSSGSCTLGSFNITQQAHALACPETRASVTISPYCDDGSGAKEDYSGTVNLSNDGSAVFYTASTGGSSISSITFDGSTSSKTIYLYDHQEEIVKVTAADADISSQAASGTDFRAFGFTLSMASVSPFVCGSSNIVTVTAYGKVEANNNCSIISGFSGQKDLKVWLDPYYLDSGTTSAANNNISLNSVTLPTSTPGSNNITNINFTAGQANLDIQWNDVGRINFHVKHDDAPYDGTSGAAYDAQQRAPLLADTGLMTLLANGFNVLAKLSDGTALNNTNPLTPSPLLKAGSGSFDVEVTAVCSNSTTAANFTSAVELSANAVDFTTTGNLGPASTPSAIPVNGIATFTNLSYDEVGYFTLTATASDYLSSGIDITGNYITGRFVPDHFSLTTPSVSTAADWGGNFVYMDQPKIKVDYLLQAQNSSNVITQNYHGSFSPALISDAVENDNDGNDLSTRLTDIPGVWSNGQMAYSMDDIIFNRISSPDGPFYLLDIGLIVDDQETSIEILLQDLDMDTASSAICDPLINCSAKKLGSIDVRYGRIANNNAYGSELRPLIMPLYTQYYNGTGFILNTDDNYTTALAVSNLILSNDDQTNQLDGAITINAGSTTATLNAGFNAGDAGLSFSAPGEGNTGYSNVLLQNIDDWLLYDWDTSGTDSVPPTVRASFGLYNRSKRLIYTREVY